MGEGLRKSEVSVQWSFKKLGDTEQATSVPRMKNIINILFSHRVMVKIK